MQNSFLFLPLCHYFVCVVSFVFLCCCLLATADSSDVCGSLRYGLIAALLAKAFKKVELKNDLAYINKHRHELNPLYNIHKYRNRC